MWQSSLPHVGIYTSDILAMLAVTRNLTWFYIGCLEFVGMKAGIVVFIELIATTDQTLESCLLINSHDSPDFPRNGLDYWRDTTTISIMKAFKLLMQRLTLALGLRDEFLCDSCALNYRDICRRHERPNARICPDYRKK